MLLPNALADRLGDGKDYAAMKRRTTSDEERKLFEQTFRRRARIKAVHAQARRRKRKPRHRPQRRQWRDPGAAASAA